MPDTSVNHLPESPEQRATKSQLLNLKEKIDKIVREYNESGIPEVPRKIRKDLGDRLTLTLAPVTAGISSTKWRNERAQDVYRRVLNACPQLYVAFISVIAPTACIQPDLGRIVTELLHLVEETPIRLNLNSEGKEFFRSAAEAGAFTEDPWYTKFISSLFPGESPLPTETPGHDHSLSSVCGSPNTVQTSPKSSPPSLAPGTERSGIKHSATVQSPTAQLAVHTASSVLDNVQDIEALDFQQRAVATFGASDVIRKRKRVTPPNEAQSEPTAVPEISSNHPNFTRAQEEVIENASLQGIAKVFDEYMCGTIRRVTVQGDLKAAVTMVFPVWGGPVDCLISLDICEREVEQLAMALFGAKVKWVEQVLHVVLKEGITLIIPHSEATLKGVPDKAIIQVFGPEIHDAITENPVHRRELEEGKLVTECVSMILTKNGAIINLSLGLEGGLQIQNKIYT